MPNLANVYNAEIKDHFVDDIEWFASRFIDKAIVIILQQISIVCCCNWWALTLRTVCLNTE